MNAIILMVSLFNFVMLMFGSWFFYPRLCGSILNCLCGYCCLNGVSIALVSARFSAAGELCSYNIAPVTYNGNGQFEFDPENGNYQTYKDEANLMLGLGVVQFILSCCQCTLCCIPLATTPTGEASKKEKKEKKNKKDKKSKDKKSKDKHEVQ